MVLTMAMTREMVIRSEGRYSLVASLKVDVDYTWSLSFQVVEVGGVRTIFEALPKAAGHFNSKIRS
jgi:hypothetical protein